jgi:hypothetical protein
MFFFVLFDSDCCVMLLLYLYKQYIYCGGSVTKRRIDTNPLRIHSLASTNHTVNPASDTLYI